MTDGSARRQRRILRIALGAVALLALAAGLGALWAGQTGRLDTINQATILIFAVVIGVAAIGTALTYSPGAITKSSDTGRWDRAQRDRNRDLVLNIIGGFIWVGYGSVEIQESLQAGETQRAAIYIALVVLWLFVAPAILMGWTVPARRNRAWLDDELSRAFRAKAAATGFAALLLGGVGTYLVSLFAPDRTPNAILFALWLGGGAASAHFVWLHNSAQPEDADLEDDG